MMDIISNSLEATSTIISRGNDHGTRNSSLDAGRATADHPSFGYVLA
jgi:hypothetical protein